MPTRSWFVSAIAQTSSVCCPARRRARRRAARSPATRHERVVGERLLRPLFRSQIDVEPVGELARRLAEPAEPAKQIGRGALAARLEARIEVLRRPPTPSARDRSPGSHVRSSSSAVEQPHLARARLEDARRDQPVDRRVLRPRERRPPRRTRPRPSRAARTTRPPSACRHRSRPPARQDLVEHLVDEPERRADSHRLTVSLHAPSRSARRPPCPVRSPPARGRQARCCRAEAVERLGQLRSQRAQQTRVVS